MTRSSGRTILTFLLAILIATTTGCGAIFNGTSQTLTATSAPDQAMVKTEPGTGQFTTPAALSLERKNNYILTFTREGYQPATFPIRRSLQGGIVALDVLFTGLIGVVIDAATGAWYKLTPESAVVSLTRLSADGPGPQTIDVAVMQKGDSLSLRSSVPGVTIDVQTRK